jgi:hypothetical protein
MSEHWLIPFMKDLLKTVEEGRYTNDLVFIEGYETAIHEVMDLIKQLEQSAGYIPKPSVGCYCLVCKANWIETFSDNNTGPFRRN